MTSGRPQAAKPYGAELGEQCGGDLKTLFVSKWPLTPDVTKFCEEHDHIVFRVIDPGFAGDGCSFSSSLCLFISSLLLSGKKVTVYIRSEQVSDDWITTLRCMNSRTFCAVAVVVLPLPSIGGFTVEVVPTP